MATVNRFEADIWFDDMGYGRREVVIEWDRETQEFPRLTVSPLSGTTP